MEHTRSSSGSSSRIGGMAATWDNANYAWCSSGQPRGMAFPLLARQVCAAALQQHRLGEEIDVFLFVFLSQTRCGGCWDASCPDRGLGHCFRHRGMAPDALNAASRAAMRDEWIRMLQRASAMCPGANVGDVGVAEDWEFDRVEVADRYYKPRDIGLTQNHYAIQLWGVQQCFNLVASREHLRGRRYLAVMRARLDSFWFAPVPAVRPLLATGEILVRAASDAELRVPSDQFALVPRDHAEVHFVKWLEDLANDTFVQRVAQRVTERWNRYIGAEGALMLAFEEHGVPYSRQPFPFAVFRPWGRCFVLGQPPGAEKGCRRALEGAMHQRYVEAAVQSASSTRVVTLTGYVRMVVTTLLHVGVNHCPGQLITTLAHGSWI